MEFYRYCAYHKVALHAEFQFPTGWNSTRSSARARKFVKVSIPNGMEFYDAPALYKAGTPKFQFPTGWNSTTISNLRFGILKGVSIPNGMEFYLGLWCLYAQENERFNSQRDGILPRLSIRSAPSLRVSIPNGMEFYGAYLSLLVGRVRVSIPNGMEFYKKAESLREANPEFQFPTGWNSTWIHQYGRHESRQFQFPTGWNST